MTNNTTREEKVEEWEREVDGWNFEIAEKEYMKKFIRLVRQSAKREAWEEARKIVLGWRENDYENLQDLMETIAGRFDSKVKE